MGNKHANTRDVPRFRALLWRQNPYVLLFFFLVAWIMKSGYKWCSWSCSVVEPAWATEPAGG